MSFISIPVPSAHRPIAPWLLFIWWRSKHSKCPHNPVFTSSLPTKYKFENQIENRNGQCMRPIYKINQSWSIAFGFIHIFSPPPLVSEFKHLCCFVSYPYHFSVIKITKLLYFIYCIVHATCRRTNRLTNYSIGYFSRNGRLTIIIFQAFAYRQRYCSICGKIKQLQAEKIMSGRLMSLLRWCSVGGYFFPSISMAHFAVLSNEMRTVIYCTRLRLSNVGKISNFRNLNEPKYSIRWVFVCIFNTNGQLNCEPTLMNNWIYVHSGNCTEHT